MLPGNLDHAPEIQVHSSLGHNSTVICGTEDGETKEDSHLLARKRTCLSISSKNIPPEINGLKYYGMERSLTQLKMSWGRAGHNFVLKVILFWFYVLIIKTRTTKVE